MAGYRRVNYYELCRLCTSSEGTKMHIFREEGRRRQLPSKIQMCLPLQVNEEDSLPKIVCRDCVEKLESLFEFRNSCVTAEAMLESYFTSLRYSEDFIREGKVYVKDESPKKRIQLEAEKAALKVPSVQTIASIPVSVDGLNNLVQAATIQIVNHSDAELVRQPQYKCVEVPMSTSGGESNVRFTYQTCTSAETHTTPSVTFIKAAHSQDDKSDSAQDHPTITQGPSYYLRLPSNDETDNEEHQELTQVVGEEQLHQAMVFTPNHGQEVLVFDLNKDKDEHNETTILRTDDRTSIAQIGEFLRMKTTVVVDDDEEEEEEHAHAGTEHDSVRCEQCGKELDSAEEQANHELTCPGGVVEDKSGGGNFSCDVCGKLFKRKEHLFQHSKLHSGERPFSCAICTKSFSRKEHLVRHAVSHTGQKSYACDLCPKSFSRKDNLHKHRKTHGVAGPYVCETCGKSFVVKHYYLMHKATHAPTDSPQSLPFRCDICYRGFSVKSHLISHKLRHRGRAGQPMEGSGSEETPAEPEEDPLATSTVNAAAILPPNVMHQGPTGSPLFHVSTGTNTTTYLTTAVVDNYRRLHPS